MVWWSPCSCTPSLCRCRYAWPRTTGLHVRVCCCVAQIVHHTHCQILPTHPRQPEQSSALPPSTYALPPPHHHTFLRAGMHGRAPLCARVAVCGAASADTPPAPATRSSDDACHGMFAEHPTCPLLMHHHPPHTHTHTHLAPCDAHPQATKSACPFPPGCTSHVRLVLLNSLSKHARAAGSHTLYLITHLSSSGIAPAACTP